MHGTIHGAVNKMTTAREKKKKNVENEDGPQDGNSTLNVYTTKWLAPSNNHTSTDMGIP